MALNGTVLGCAIGQTLFDAIPAGVKQCMSAAQCTEMLNTLQSTWQCIASDIVSHIVTNAQVSVTVSTTGSATAQTGSGTGTIS